MKIILLPIALTFFLFASSILSGETKLVSKVFICMKNCKKLYNKKLLEASNLYSDGKLSYEVYRRELINADKDFYICKKICNAKYGKNFN